MNAEDIWPIVKLRLGLVDESLKPLIETYIEEIGNRILHYCSIKDVPEGLKFVWVSMVIDLIRLDLPNIDEISDTVGGGEKISIGDTSVSPAGASSGNSNLAKSVVDKVVTNYHIDLNRYRKLRW